MVHILDIVVNFSLSLPLLDEQQPFEFDYFRNSVFLTTHDRDVLWVITELHVLARQAAFPL